MKLVEPGSIQRSEGKAKRVIGPERPIARTEDED